jgi:hypothetical protein
MFSNYQVLVVKEAQMLKKWEDLLNYVEKPVKSTGTIVVDASGTIQAISEFEVNPEDHGIKIPGMVRKNIEERIQVNVRMDYQKM